jgi:putative transposase
MLKSYHYRIYPTKSQISTLNRHLEICRHVYNDTLAYRKQSWETSKTNISLFDTNKLLPQWKKEHPEYKGVFSQVLQNCQVRVDLAYKSFFRRVKNGENPGYPRFKGYGRYDSITYPQLGFKISPENEDVHLSKIGTIKTTFHRESEGTPKTLTVRKTPTGKWYVSIVCEYTPRANLPECDKIVGIDVGISSFATLSDGTHISNPKFYEIEEKSLAKSQRKLSKLEKGTHARLYQRKVVARIHERIRDNRNDFAHKLSRKFVNEYGVICIEDLDINNMISKENTNSTTSLSKRISDVSWNTFMNYLVYKAEEAGRHVIKVDPRNTSQMCSRCGKLPQKVKSLSDRIHLCTYCGYKEDRDVNAAINIMRLGLQSLAKHRSPRIYSRE